MRAGVDTQMRMHVDQARRHPTSFGIENVSVHRVADFSIHPESLDFSTHQQQAGFVQAFAGAGQDGGIDDQQRPRRQWLIGGRVGFRGSLGWRVRRGQTQMPAAGKGSHDGENPLDTLGYYPVPHIPGFQSRAREFRKKLREFVDSTRMQRIIWALHDPAAIILAMNSLPSPEELRTWIEHSLAQRENILATSNQGTILLFRQDGVDLIVKTAMGRGLLLKARRKTLSREYQAYRRLQGLAGVPECYGMIDNRHLLLEYVPGIAYRDADLRERERWFASLLEILRAIHARGVSHGDLKSKANLRVTPDAQPCVVDFGTAFILKPGFHPLNNWLFRTGKRLDINAWVKHKYHGYYRDASAADRALLDYGWLEILVRRVSGRPMDRLRGREGEAEAD